METIALSQQQSLRIAELPEDYRVVGINDREPLVRKPTGQVLRVRQDGRLIAANRGLADRGADEPDVLAGGVRPTTPYTSISG
jgi:hypothetical protein